MIFSLGCKEEKIVFSEDIFIQPDSKDSFVIRSYPDLELDSVWRYQIDDKIVRVYTRDSLNRCIGPVNLYFFSGELHGYGTCIEGYFEGKWFFYNESGRLLSIKLFSKGKLYQRWFFPNNDTLKLVYPIIDIEPRTAFIHDTFKIRVNYIFDGIDTTGWDYYLHFDFINKDIYTDTIHLPRENFYRKYEGEEIKENLKIYFSGEHAMYGYTLAINRETGDSVYHYEITDQFFTTLDTTFIEL